MVKKGPMDIRLLFNFSYESYQDKGAAAASVGHYSTQGQLSAAQPLEEEVLEISSCRLNSTNLNSFWALNILCSGYCLKRIYSKQAHTARAAAVPAGHTSSRAKRLEMV